MPLTHTILLADDDAAVRALWTCFLACQNYHLLAAANGEEALEVGANAYLAQPAFDQRNFMEILQCLRGQIHHMDN